MKYTPTDGQFSGQQGYGYRSLEAFIDAAARINAGKANPSDYQRSQLACIGDTFRYVPLIFLQ
jgi:D-galacturonate reductase